MKTSGKCVGYPESELREREKEKGHKKKSAYNKEQVYDMEE